MKIQEFLYKYRNIVVNVLITSNTAYGLGFCSESYFIACFRNEFGITPKEYMINKGKL